MQPVYAKHRLAPQEQADLRVYLMAASSQPLANTEVPFLVLSLGGFSAAMIAVGIVWRHRLRSVASAGRTAAGRALSRTPSSETSGARARPSLLPRVTGVRRTT
jgi:hypothetical protein